MSAIFCLWSVILRCVQGTDFGRPNVFVNIYSYYSGLRYKRGSRRLVNEKTFLYISIMSYSRTFFCIFHLRFSMKPQKLWTKPYPHTTIITHHAVWACDSARQHSYFRESKHRYEKRKKDKETKSLKVCLVFLRGISICSVIWTYIHYKFVDYFI